MAKHFLDSILLRIFNMADTHWVIQIQACTTDRERFTRTSEASTGYKWKPRPVFVLILMSVWMQP